MDSTQPTSLKFLDSDLLSSTELGPHLFPCMKLSASGNGFSACFDAGKLGQADGDGGERQFGDTWLAKLPPPPYPESDPKVLLRNLVFLEQKVYQLQGVVQSMIRDSVDHTVGFPRSGGDVGGFLMRQQIVVADTASIIAQMISTAGRLLHGRTEVGLPDFGYLGHLLRAQNSQEVGIGSSAAVGVGVGDGSGASWHDRDSLGSLNSGIDGIDGGWNEHKTIPVGAEEGFGNWVEQYVCSVQDTECGSALAARDLVLGARKDEEDEVDDEKVVISGCYEVLEVEKEEILATHAHFCVICGKGFKRDANLRMHMRGHGDMYKTQEALVNPNKGGKMTDFVSCRRYSCPFEGCKRNQKHTKFQPLKTILCVKNHYRRSHCDKSYTCSRCNSKRFSVIADLKTHEKHCGEDKWQCSCGTTFSRKDKLFGHVTLFQGHSPVLPLNEIKGAGVSDVMADKMKNGGKTGLKALTPVCGRGPGFADLSRAVEYKRVEFGRNHQTVLRDTNFPSEENNRNFPMDDIGSAYKLQSSPTITGSAFSLHALLRDFIETNGGDTICSDT